MSWSDINVFIIFASIMNGNKIYDALMSAYSLINYEYDTVCDEDLKEEYDNVLNLLKEAMDELNN